MSKINTTNLDDQEKTHNDQKDKLPTENVTKDCKQADRRSSKDAKHLDICLKCFQSFDGIPSEVSLFVSDHICEGNINHLFEFERCIKLLKEASIKFSPAPAIIPIPPP